MDWGSQACRGKVGSLDRLTTIHSYNIVFFVYTLLYKDELTVTNLSHFLACLQNMCDNIIIISPLFRSKVFLSTLNEIALTSGTSGIYFLEGLSFHL